MHIENVIFLILSKIAYTKFSEGPAIQHNGYTLVRKWFVAQFPEFRKNPLFYLNYSPALVSGAAFLDQETAAPDQEAA